MKIKLAVVAMCLSLCVAEAVFAGNARQQQLIETLKVTSTNEVGEVIATDGADVNIGGAAIGGADVSGILDIETNNTVGGKIDASGEGAVVSVGGFSGKNLMADNVTFKAIKNEVTGDITAKNGGVVLVGAARLDNMKFKTVTITTKNTVRGNIEADGATVNIGSVTR